MTVQPRSVTFTRRYSSSSTSQGGASGARSRMYNTISAVSAENSTSPAPIHKKSSAKRSTTCSAPGPA